MAKQKIEKNINNKKLEYKQERKSYIITISILVFIAFISIFGITYQVFLNSTKTGYVTLKPVDVTLSSGKENHQLSVKITLSGKSKNLNKLNMEQVQLLTKETIKQLDYQSIIKKGGDDYIKNAILQTLRQNFGDNIEQVNLDSLLTDVTIKTPNEEDYNNNSDVHSIDEYLKGFSWSNKK
ncbi:hypothetical protein [[Clostridium] colinum]|uniref:hypothetical protein n=1 Tax=[Clostridium] colinum TaxID=36835 RepID=UPI0020255548|nr:hypothetical protein [[Clostridium] colinum]